MNIRIAMLLALIIFMIPPKILAQNEPPAQEVTSSSVRG